MSQAIASKLTRQATGPEMSDYLESEIYALCDAIQDHGTPAPAGTGMATIKFIDLFRVHSVVSNRMLSVLIKARKSGFVQFKGELLLQGKDDNEPITLIKMPPKAVQITKTQMPLAFDPQLERPEETPLEGEFDFSYTRFRPG